MVGHPSGKVSRKAARLRKGSKRSSCSLLVLDELSAASPPIATTGCLRYVLLQKHFCACCSTASSSSSNQGGELRATQNAPLVHRKEPETRLRHGGGAHATGKAQLHGRETSCPDRLRQFVCTGNNSLNTSYSTLNGRMRARLHVWRQCTQPLTGALAMTRPRRARAGAAPAGKPAHSPKPLRAEQTLRIQRVLGCCCLFRGRV